MELTFLTLSLGLMVVAAQYEKDTHEGGIIKRSDKAEWFWESSTTLAPETTTTEAAATTLNSLITVKTEELAVESSKNLNDTKIEYSQEFKPANITSGRSSKAMNFDLFGGGGIREGRILNEDPGNRKISLQGFIPIVSFSERDDGDSEKRDSPKRSQNEDLYYDGPYPPQPIQDQGKKEASDDAQPQKNYYLPFPGSSSHKNHQSEDIFPSGPHYGSRIVHDKPVNVQRVHDFYINPPTQKPSDSQRDVRFVDANDYHKRPNQQNQFFIDSKRPSESSSGHFSVSSKPDNVQYAPAVPYPPESDDENKDYRGHKHTTPKYHRPGGKQFEVYEDNNYENFVNEDEKCICVPFYLCRNGYLMSGRSQGPTEDIDERSARKISKRSTGNETIEAKDATNLEIPHYTADVMERMIGLSNTGHSCGLLRRCCKALPTGSPTGLLPFSPDNYPIPHPVDINQLPPGLFPPGLQQQFQRPQVIHEGQPQAFIVNVPDQYPQPSPHQEHVIVVPQEFHPNRRPKPTGPRPGYHPSSKPIRPQLPIHPPHPKPHRPRPLYPHPKPSIHRPVYPQTQPQPVYQEHPPVYPPPKPAYQPDYSQPKPQLHQGQCGARNGLGIHGRVKNLQYHDDASEFGEYPWQVAILLKVGPGNNLFVCGGTLISSLWVATAAHCLKKHQADELKIRLGDWDVHRDDEFYPYVEKFVTEVVPHPEFYPGNLQNDIALLRMDSHVDPSSPHISPACLPEPHETFDNQRCWVTGWGKNAFGEQGEYQSVLKEVDVPMVSHRDCEHRLKQTRLGPQYQLHPGFVCAGGEPGKDACTGDGGSPLVCDVHGTWKVVGLVSWGIGCGQPGVPGIYVNIAKYRTWIDTIAHRYG